MAWNGSEQNGRATSMKSPDSHPRRAVGSSRRPYQRGLLAGILVIALLGVGLWWIFGGRGATRPNTVSTAKRNSQIATVTPHIVTNALARTNAVTEVKKSKPYSKYVDYDPNKVYTDSRGVLRYKKGDGRVPHSDEEMEKYLVHHTKYDSGLPAFKHTCEQDIAVLLTLEPGQMIFGDPTASSSWKKEFLKSIMDPTVIEESDSEEDRAVKQAVADAKKELVQRMKNGEDICQIMSEARDEMRRLANYREEVISLARQSAAEFTTPGEVDDCLGAVNKMLAEKGLAPVKANAFVRNSVLRALNKTNPKPTTTNEVKK